LKGRGKGRKEGNLSLLINGFFVMFATIASRKGSMPVEVIFRLVNLEDDNN